MHPSIPDILAPLDPYWDRIIRQPMTRTDVAKLERQVGLTVPVPLRDYLMAVGLFQDLTCWGVSPIEVYDRTSQFVSTRQFLCEILPPQKQDLFPFGDDGAGNVFCLPIADDVPCRIHFVDHESRKVSKQKDFTVWLQAVVTKVVRGIRRRVPNKHKVWAVQFSFGGISYEDLATLLGSVGQFKEIDAGWTNQDTTEEVTSSERQIELNGENLTIGRLEYAGWDAPRFHFEMRESLVEGLEHSRIGELNRFFKEKCPGYRLVDYGPLDSRQLEKAK
jgi:hypothetical protein